VVGVAALMAALIVLALAVPLSGNAEHFSGHVAIGLPLLLMLVLVTRTWPHPGSGPAGRLARGTLVSGLAVSGVGLLLEAVGALGYSEDGFGRANELVRLHDIGVALWPVGFVLLLTGAVMTTGVRVAERHSDARSRMVTGAAVLAVTAAVLFIAGGFVFGY
jgi:hypothetical protein